jgi:transposase-like protein
MKKRPSFTKEFKLEAVRLLELSTKAPADLARELGIRRNQLYSGKNSDRPRAWRASSPATAGAPARRRNWRSLSARTHALRRRMPF